MKTVPFGRSSGNAVCSNGPCVPLRARRARRATVAGAAAARKGRRAMANASNSVQPARTTARKAQWANMPCMAHTYICGRREVPCAGARKERFADTTLHSHAKVWPANNAAPLTTAKRRRRQQRPFFAGIYFVATRRLWYVNKYSAAERKRACTVRCVKSVAHSKRLVNAALLTSRKRRGAQAATLCTAQV